MFTFKEFTSKQHRDMLHQLKLIKRILEQNNFKTKLNKHRDIFLYVESPLDLSFGGIRIYQIGKKLAFRVQQDFESHPYGQAYSLDVESIYNDYLSDTENELKAGKLCIKAIVNIIGTFFKDCEKSEDNEFQSTFPEKEPIVDKPDVVDYSNKINTKL